MHAARINLRLVAGRGRVKGTWTSGALVSSFGGVVLKAGGVFAQVGSGVGRSGVGFRGSERVPGMHRGSGTVPRVAG